MPINTTRFGGRKTGTSPERKGQANGLDHIVAVGDLRQRGTARVRRRVADQAASTRTEAAAEASAAGGYPAEAQKEKRRLCGNTDDAEQEKTLYLQYTGRRGKCQDPVICWLGTTGLTRLTTDGTGRRWCTANVRAAAKEALGYLDIPDDKTPEPQKQVYDLLTNIKLLAAYFEDKLEAEI